MNKKLKIAIWAGSIIVIGVGIPITVYGVKRSRIRGRLDEAYNNPSSINAVGGLGKLVVSGIYDSRLHQNAGKATISKVEARERAKEIWENYSTYFWSSSDTSAILGAFDGLGHRHDVSKIADEFYQTYSEALETVIEAVFEDSDQKNIFIDKLLKLSNN